MGSAHGFSFQVEFLVREVEVYIHPYECMPIVHSYVDLAVGSTMCNCVVHMSIQSVLGVYFCLRNIQLTCDWVGIEPHGTYRRKFDLNRCNRVQKFKTFIAEAIDIL